MRLLLLLPLPLPKQYSCRLENYSLIASRCWGVADWLVPSIRPSVRRASAAFYGSSCRLRHHVWSLVCGCALLFRILRCSATTRKSGAPCWWRHTYTDVGLAWESRVFLNASLMWRNDVWSLLRDVSLCLNRSQDLHPL